jgi:hypothetical protein
MAHAYCQARNWAPSGPFTATSGCPPPPGTKPASSSAAGHRIQVGRFGAQLGELGEQLATAPVRVDRAQSLPGERFGRRTREGRFLAGRQAGNAVRDQLAARGGRDDAVDGESRRGLHAREQIDDQAASLGESEPWPAASRLFWTPSRSSFQLASNLSTPSSSSTLTTSSMSTPTPARSEMTLRALS